MTTCVRTIVIALAVLLIAGGSLFTTAPAMAQRKARGKSRKTTMPAPKAEAINAEQMQSLLKRDGSKPLLVNYWATWCDPCRDEFPELVKIDTDYRPKGLD